MPRARGGVRRVAPRHGRVRGAGRVRRCCSGCSPTTSTASSPGRAQYTHLLDPDDAHVVDDIIVWWVDADRLPRDAERVEHRPARRRARRGGRGHGAGDVEFADVTADARGARGAGARGAGAARDGRSPTRPAVPRFAVQPSSRGELGSSRAPATPAKTASSSTCPAGAPRRAVGRAARRRASRRPGSGARDTLRLEAGLPLHGHELGPGHHAAAGRPRLGRALGQGRLPRARAARGRARAGRGPPAARARASTGGDPARRATR